MERAQPALAIDSHAASALSSRRQTPSTPMSSMPFFTADPLLTLEGHRMRNIDPQNPWNLYGMWSVFSKCSGTLEEGRRLENMSWRLWNHQTVLRSSTSDLNCSPTNPLSISRRPSECSTKVPDLSRSVESISDDESDHGRSESFEGSGSMEEPLGFNEFTNSNKERRLLHEKSFTPADLEHLVTSIKSKRELRDPISTPSLLRQPAAIAMAIAASDRPSSPTPRSYAARPVESSTSTVATEITDDTHISPSGTSDTSVDSGDSRHSVIRGFQPGGAISTYRSSSSLAPPPAPILKSSKKEIPPSSKRKAGMFSIGAGSSGDDTNSLRDNMSPKKSVSIDSEIRDSPKKHASFHDKIFQIGSSLRRSSSTDDDDEAVLESDDEDDDYSTEEEVSESAIDDEDDDAWEDEAENEDKPMTFARIDSKPNLTSRRSLLTDKVHEDHRASALQAAAARPPSNMRRSRTSTPNGPSMPASPEADSPIADRNNQDSRTQPIDMSQSNAHPPCPPAFSPRTTRRNMLAVELDIDLRKNMLVERQQKNYYANGLQRRHTSNDVKNVKDYPEAGGAGASAASTHRRGGSNERSWNEYFESGFGEYHQKGW